MRDGSEGVESDVHVSLDDVVIMFHDPSLDRTTNMKGLIREKNWYGPDGMEHARTKKEPQQSIPTFAETVELLMQPENRHVVFDVDVKVFNEPTRLFSLMHAIISSHDGWETLLAPRIVLGLWHPRFLKPAEKLLPYCRRSHIGISPRIAKQYFWDSCDSFSMAFSALATMEGDTFRQVCQADGKKLMVWTVNEPEQMMECIRWGVDVIITDVPAVYLKLRSSVESDYAKANSEMGRVFLWTNYKYWTPFQMYIWRWQKSFLETNGGPFDVEHEHEIPATSPVAAVEA